jgi:hypothetical protein
VLLGVQEQTAAAPVPTHLMKPPFRHPTAVGTKWVYDRKGQDLTLLLTNIEEKKEGKLVTLEEADATGKTEPYQKRLVTAQEWYLTEESGEPYDPMWCSVKAPHGEKQQWEYATARDRLGVIKGTKAQAAKTERLKVPAGVFEAVKVENRRDPQGGVDSTHWYASGVGLVQIDDPPYMVLKSFAPGKE